jgi:hypothetical protein
LGVAAFLLELPVTRRGLMLLFLLAAAVLARAGWLRPPLSPDIRSYHIPIGLPLDLGTASAPSPDEIYRGPYHIVPVSVGLVLLGFLAVATLVVLIRPSLFGLVVGLLLTLTIAGNAAVVLNHPALMELIDLEYEQQMQIASVLIASKDNLLVNYTNARSGAVELSEPTEDQQRGDLGRGWVYLMYGRYLALWATVGCLFGIHGPLRRRVIWLGVWGVAGLALGCAVCWPRLHAEYHWWQAKAAEGQCDYAGARQHLDRAVALFPEFDRLERTWLLTGKLDSRTDRSSIRQRFFRAYQTGRYKERPVGVLASEDLPWIIPGVPDYRGNLASPPSGFDEERMALSTGTPHFMDTMSRSEGMISNTFIVDMPLQTRKAMNLMEELLAESADPDVAVRHQAARFWTQYGVNFYLVTPVMLEEGPDFAAQDRAILAADAWWRRAQEVAPTHRDIATYRTLARAFVDRANPDFAAQHPEQTEQELRPMTNRLADQVLRADLLGTVGNAYFANKDWSQARRRYAKSVDDYSMPKIINFRGMKGLGGL